MIAILIGSPGSGKTTILKELQKRGVKVFHADSYINKIYKKDEIGYETIKKIFGEEFVNEKGVDKLKLGNFLTINPEKIEELNNNIFPLIKNYLDGKDNFVAELPIITNSHIKFNYDKVIFISANDEIIKQRLIKDNKFNREFIKKIVEDWKNNSHIFDFKIDTSNGIKKEDVDKIVDLLN